MGYEDHIEELLAEDVLGEDGDDGIRLTRSFLDAVEEQQARVDRGERDWHELIADAVTEDVVVERVLNLAWKQAEFLGYLLALASYTGNTLDVEWLRTTAVLSQLDRPLPRTEGAPRAFFPIHGDWLGVFLDLFPNAIVYVWREDCDPCDVMKGEFDDIFDEPPDDLALFSIYGPDHARFLHEEYDVTGGPATLFVLDGEVDARLYGAQYRNVIDNEIEVLRDLSAG